MKRALLVIDVQNEYFAGELLVTYPMGTMGNILKAMKAARANCIPIVAIQHTAPQSDSSSFIKGSKAWEIHEGVLNIGYDYIVEKNLPGSFTGTNLEEILRNIGIDTVVISGYMSQMCCDTTARQALHLGFNVEFLSDATGTLAFSNYAGTVTAEELHRAILVTQAMRFSKVMSTKEWIESI